MSRLLLTALFAMATLWTLPAHAAGQYEEGLKQLAEGVIATLRKRRRHDWRCWILRIAKASSHRSDSS